MSTKGHPIDATSVTYLRPGRPTLNNISRSLSEIEERYVVAGNPGNLPGWRMRVGLDEAGNIVSLLLGRLGEEPHSEPDSHDDSKPRTMLHQPTGTPHMVSVRGPRDPAPVPLTMKRLRELPLNRLIHGDPTVEWEGAVSMIKRDFAEPAEEPVVAKRPGGGRKPLSDHDVAETADEYLSYHRQGFGIEAAAVEMGMSYGGLKARLAKARERGILYSRVPRTRHSALTRYGLELLGRPVPEVPHD